MLRRTMRFATALRGPMSQLGCSLWDASWPERLSFVGPGGWRLNSTPLVWLKNFPYNWGGVIMQMNVAVFFVGFAPSWSRLLSKWIASPSSNTKHSSSVSVISIAPVNT